MKSHNREKASETCWSCALALFTACTIWLTSPALSTATSASGQPTTQSAYAAQKIRGASQEVYRILVDVDGAIMGGTSFLVSGRRIVATCNHVIDGANTLRLGFADSNGKGRTVALRVIATYPQKDLALLEAQEDLPGQPLSLVTEPLEPPMDLYAIGFPTAADPKGGLSVLGGHADANAEPFYKPSVIKGYVSRVLESRWTATQLQHQTPILPGYSGSPLIRSDGGVVGISASTHKEASGISYGVLAVDLAEFAAACSLPVQVISSDTPRPPSSQRSAIVTQDTVNTASQQLQSINTPKNREKLARADKLLRDGSVSAARLLCEFLVQSTQAPEAYICLARTYDPTVLRELGVMGMSGEPATAKRYYDLARTGGQRQPEHASPAPANDAPAPIASACNNSICRLVETASGPSVTCRAR